jgi:hypothetical protein
MELYDLYSSTYVVTVIKSRRTELTGVTNITNGGEKECLKTFEREPSVKRILGRPKQKENKAKTL